MSLIQLVCFFRLLESFRVYYSQYYSLIHLNETGTKLRKLVIDTVPIPNEPALGSVLFWFGFGLINGVSVIFFLIIIVFV